MDSRGLQGVGRFVDGQGLRPDDSGHSSDIRVSARNVSVSYSDVPAIANVSIDFGTNSVTALIGPSGCGKTTFLRCLNRLNDRIEECKVRGRILIDGEDIYGPNIDAVQLRRVVGMVFQKPNPFPRSVFENVAYGLKIHGIAKNKTDLQDQVEEALVRAGLFDEVKDRLDAAGTSLSGGQQQRLCIARAIAVRPEVILMDEPCSALDPLATANIEELIDELSASYTIIIVTHSMQQAARVSEHTAFFHLGELVEQGATKNIFTTPEDARTEAYVSGRIG